MSRIIGAGSARQSKNGDDATDSAAASSVSRPSSDAGIRTIGDVFRSDLLLLVAAGLSCVLTAVCIGIMAAKPDYGCEHGFLPEQHLLQAWICGGAMGALLLHGLNALTSRRMLKDPCTWYCLLILVNASVRFLVPTLGRENLVCVVPLGGLGGSARGYSILTLLFWGTTAPTMIALLAALSDSLAEQQRAFALTALSLAFGAAATFTETFALWIIFLLASVASLAFVVYYMFTFARRGLARTKDKIGRRLWLAMLPVGLGVWLIIPTVWFLGQLNLISMQVEVDLLSAVDYLVKLAYVVLHIGSVSYGKVLEEQAEITLADAARLRAEASNQAKRQFLRWIGHESRVPLQAGLLALEELQAGFASKELVVSGMPAQQAGAALQMRLRRRQAPEVLWRGFADAADTALRSIGAVGKLLDDFLSIAKIEDGRLDLEPVRFGIRKWLLDTATLFSNALKKKHIRLRIVAAKSVPKEVFADDNRLRQVVSNYISNAIKFSPSGGDIVIRATLVQKRPVILVGSTDDASQSRSLGQGLGAASLSLGLPSAADLAAGSGCLVPIGAKSGPHPGAASPSWLPLASDSAATNRDRQASSTAHLQPHLHLHASSLALTPCAEGSSVSLAAASASPAAGASHGAAAAGGSAARLGRTGAGDQTPESGDNPTGHRGLLASLGPQSRKAFFSAQSPSPVALPASPLLASTSSSPASPATPLADTPASQRAGSVLSSGSIAYGDAASVILDHRFASSATASRAGRSTAHPDSTSGAQIERSLLQPQAATATAGNGTVPAGGRLHADGRNAAHAPSFVSSFAASSANPLSHAAPQSPAVLTPAVGGIGLTDAASTAVQVPATAVTANGAARHGPSEAGATGALSLFKAPFSLSGLSSAFSRTRNPFSWRSSSSSSSSSDGARGATAVVPPEGESRSRRSAAATAGKAASRLRSRVQPVGAAQAVPAASSETSTEFSGDQTVPFWRISVEDHGAGLTADEISKLFQPYSQIRAGANQGGGGTGLGLVNCKRIVELAGGTVGVTSTPGVRTSFFMEVPLVLPQQAGASVAAQSIDQAALQAVARRAALAGGQSHGFDLQQTTPILMAPHQQPAPTPTSTASQTHTAATSSQGTVGAVGGSRIQSASAPSVGVAPSGLALRTTSTAHASAPESSLTSTGIASVECSSGGATPVPASPMIAGQVHPHSANGSQRQLSGVLARLSISSAISNTSERAVLKVQVRASGRPSGGPGAPGQQSPSLSVIGVSGGVGEATPHAETVDEEPEAQAVPSALLSGRAVTRTSQAAAAAHPASRQSPSRDSVHGAGTGSTVSGAQNRTQTRSDCVASTAPALTHHGDSDGDDADECEAEEELGIVGDASPTPGPAEVRGDCPTQRIVAGELPHASAQAPEVKADGGNAPPGEAATEVVVVAEVDADDAEEGVEGSANATSRSSRSGATMITSTPSTRAFAATTARSSRRVLPSPEPASMVTATAATPSQLPLVAQESLPGMPCSAAATATATAGGAGGVIDGSAKEGVEGTGVAAAAVEEEAVDAEGRKRLLRAVVVDDVSTNRELFARMLRRNGVDVVFTAEDGQDCLNKLVAFVRDGSNGPSATESGAMNLGTTVDRTIQAFFIDSSMPVMNGPELATRLRELGYTNPIFGVTGNALAEDREEFIRAGASYVLIKPCSGQHLREAVANLGLALP